MEEGKDSRYFRQAKMVNPSVRLSVFSLSFTVMRDVCSGAGRRLESNFSKLH